MIQVTLKPAESCEVEIPCDESLASLSARAIGGRCVVDIQATQDGLTWGSPLAQLRLNSEAKTAHFKLPEGSRKIRVLIEASDRLTLVELSADSEPSKVKDSAAAA